MSKTIGVQNGRETPLCQMAADLRSVLAQTGQEPAGWAGSNLKSRHCPLEARTFCCHCMGSGGWDIQNRSRKMLSLQSLEFPSSAIPVSATEVLHLYFGPLECFRLFLHFLLHTNPLLCTASHHQINSVVLSLTV